MSSDQQDNTQNQSLMDNLSEDTQDTPEEIVDEILHPGMVRNAKGQLIFAKGNTIRKQSAISIGKRVAMRLRRKLAKYDPKDPEQRQIVDKIFDNLIEIATDPSPKTRKESIWAANALLERAYGAPLKDQSELDALQQGQGIRIVVLPAQQLPQVSVSQTPVRPAEFIDAEIVDGKLLSD